MRFFASICSGKLHLDTEGVILLTSSISSNEFLHPFNLHLKRIMLEYAQQGSLRSVPADIEKLYLFLFMNTLPQTISCIAEQGAHYAAGF